MVTTNIQKEQEIATFSAMLQSQTAGSKHLSQQIRKFSVCFLKTLSDIAQDGKELAVSEDGLQLWILLSPPP